MLESVVVIVFIEVVVIGQGVIVKGGDDFDDLLGDSQLFNVVLIGIFFLCNFSFVGFLQKVLGVKIGSFVKDGGKFFGSVCDYFVNFVFIQMLLKLVVWEIFECDLQMFYEVILLVC